jgi:hypothetical protein
MLYPFPWYCRIKISAEHHSESVAENNRYSYLFLFYFLSDKFSERMLGVNSGQVFL